MITVQKQRKSRKQIQFHFRGKSEDHTIGTEEWVNSATYLTLRLLKITHDHDVSLKWSEEPYLRKSTRFFRYNKFFG